MKYVWKILIMVFLTTTLLACQSSSPSTSVSQEPVVRTEIPGSLPESNATQAPTTPTTTLPEEEKDMTPATSPDETAEKMVALVKQHLAQRLSISADQIVLSEIKSVVWRDASLGCPKPGIDYIQMETPGYNILLETGGKTYPFHTDATKRFVQCNT